MLHVTMQTDKKEAVGEKRFLSERKYPRSKKKNQARLHQCTDVRRKLRVDIFVEKLNLPCTYDIVHQVNEDWLCHDWVSDYSLERNIEKPSELYKVAEKFTAIGRSNGILGGIIGALEGCLVKMKSPNLSRDGVKNQGTYFSRKGFFALNVQVIVGRDKMVLWIVRRYRAFPCLKRIPP